MHFLADENFPGPSIKLLKEAGLHIERFADVDLGAPDTSVIEYASRTGAIILTFDKDFGHLVFQEGYSSPGIVFYRYRGPDPVWAGRVLLHILRDPGVNIYGQF